MHKDLPLEPLLVGTVTSSDVKLSRILPLHSNIFKPFFFGHFHVNNGHVELTGQFKMHPITVAVMTFGNAMYALAGLIALVAFLSGQENAIYGVLLIIGTPFVASYIDRAWGRDDVGWITKQLETVSEKV
jgi:hypothetical protein